MIRFIDVKNYYLRPGMKFSKLTDCLEYYASVILFDYELLNMDVEISMEWNLFDNSFVIASMPVQAHLMIDVPIKHSFNKDDKNIDIKVDEYKITKYGIIIRATINSK